MSSEEKGEHARKAGADLVLDYRREDVAERIRAAYGGVDQIVEVDFGANLSVTARVLKPGGMVASYASSREPNPRLPYYELHALNPVLRPVLVYEMSDAAKAQAIADLTRWAAETEPLFAIAERFALERVVEAHQAVERGEKVGHVLVSRAIVENQDFEVVVDLATKTVDGFADHPVAPRPRGGCDPERHQRRGGFQHRRVGDSGEVRMPE